VGAMLLEEKICITCKELKKVSEFYFRKQTGKLQGDCKSCYQSKKRKRRTERVSDGSLKYNPKKKKCIDCDNLCDARKHIVRCYSCNNKFRFKENPRLKEKISLSNKRMWQNEEYRNKMSTQMQSLRKDPEFNKKLSSSFSKNNRLTKLHKKIKEELKLIERGFMSEQSIGKYFADELNEEKRIIIEINGDYVHANPKKFKAEDIIKLPNSKYTAAEKWESDKKKIEALTSMGYRVITIWESDDLEEVKKLLEQT
jgi:very-short-patch-repair endonuclease